MQHVKSSSKLESNEYNRFNAASNIIQKTESILVHFD